MEEDPKSNSTQNGDVERHFFDPVDEYPFYDCVDTPAELNVDASLESIIKSSPETRLPVNLRRRRSVSQRNEGIFCNDLDDSSKPVSSVSLGNVVNFRARKYRFSQNVKEKGRGGDNLDRNQSSDSKGPNPNSAVHSEHSQVNNSINTPVDTHSGESTYSFSQNLKENEKRNGNSDSSMLKLSSERAHNGIDKENRENSTITTENNEKNAEYITDDLSSGETDYTSSDFLFFLANLVIKAIVFQINSLISFVTFPIWLLYCSYIFVIDPFRAIRCVKDYVMGKLLSIWGLVCESASPFVYEWLKGHKSFWRLALNFGWGFLWSVYVCAVVVGLLVMAFVVSGFVMKYLVEEPIQIKENLNFDYTKTSPVVFVPISECFGVSCGENCGEKSEIGNIGGSRVIPPYHILQVSVSMTLPESDYNRDLGIFQVRIDFLSTDGKVLASSRHPCMLQFKSQPIRLMLTFLKIAPLLTGYSSESQTLSVKIKLRGHEPTACLRVIIEQRAEFQHGAGIPEIYAASLNVESELPLLKRILWDWKKTIFIWISMTVFTMELFYTLLCCKPVIMPRVRLRYGSAGCSTPVQR
ncbi:unnamed protein product [Ilex paraguariensis]|uniref:Seipin n=1 Tax=Ilex paraguariensis TaxID=185542 RepID=A0ABC8RSV0_9AQUA